MTYQSIRCLSVGEEIEDTDYYFLTLKCLKKLYQTSEYENFVKEEIYMSSVLYREPYEKGRKDISTKSSKIRANRQEW